MKLQRFIENYRKDKGQPSHSPDRSGVFRTSQSIGTLNSRDEFTTDRSFAIKEIPIYQHSHKRQNMNQVDMLKDLCASQRPPSAKIIERGENTTVEEFFCEPLAECLPSQGFSTTFSKNKKVQLIRPHFSFRPQHLQGNDDLYQEAPSQPFYENKVEDRMGWLVRHQQQLFLGQLEALMQRVERLEAENLELEQRWLQQQQLSLKYQRGCSILQEQVAVLKEKVTNTIQQNIQIQNMIKEALLKQEMQKYHCFTKQDSRKVYKKEEDNSRIKPIL